MSGILALWRYILNADVIIGMDAGALALKVMAFTLEGNEIDVAGECHGDMVPVRGAHADVKCRADR